MLFARIYVPHIPMQIPNPEDYILNLGLINSTKRNKQILRIFENLEHVEATKYRVSNEFLPTKRYLRCRTHLYGRVESQTQILNKNGGWCAWRTALSWEDVGSAMCYLDTVVP